MKWSSTTNKNYNNICKLCIVLCDQNTKVYVEVVQTESIESNYKRFQSITSFNWIIINIVWYDHY